MTIIFNELQLDDYWSIIRGGFRPFVTNLEAYIAMQTMDAE